MSIDFTAMDDASDELPNARECREQQLRDLISKYKDLKCLWDIRCEDHRDKKKMLIVNY